MGSGLCYTRITNSPDGTKQLAATLAPYVHAGDVVVLDGDLGAGKTQFVQGFAQAFGVLEQIVSPTFNLMLAYQGHLPLYHFDLYRLEEAAQLEDIGFYETIDADGVTFIEWGSRFADAMPYSYLRVTLSASEEGKRQVSVRSVGDRARQLLCVWANDSKSRLMKCGGAE